MSVELSKRDLVSLPKSLNIFYILADVGNFYLDDFEAINLSNSECYQSVEIIVLFTFKRNLKTISQQPLE